jgi:hypothetical protein
MSAQEVAGDRFSLVCLVPTRLRDWYPHVHVDTRPNGRVLSYLVSGPIPVLSEVYSISSPFLPS